MEVRVPIFWLYDNLRLYGLLDKLKFKLNECKLVEVPLGNYRILFLHPLPWQKLFVGRNGVFLFKEYSSARASGSDVELELS